MAEGLLPEEFWPRFPSARCAYSLQVLLGPGCDGQRCLRLITRSRRYIHLLICHSGWPDDTGRELYIGTVCTNYYMCLSSMIVCTSTLVQLDSADNVYCMNVSITRLGRH